MATNGATTPPLSDDGSKGYGDRLSREREIWNHSAILEAQKFKHRLLAGFENPHIRRRESNRSGLIRAKYPGAVVLDYGCFDLTVLMIASPAFNLSAQPTA